MPYLITQMPTVTYACLSFYSEKDLVPRGSNLPCSRLARVLIHVLCFRCKHVNNMEVFVLLACTNILHWSLRLVGKRISASRDSGASLRQKWENYLHATDLISSCKKHEYRYVEISSNYNVLVHISPLR